MKLGEEIPGTGPALSRPLRFDPHLARAKDVVLGGTIGTPRTLELCWSFDGNDVTAVATELVDVACFLLDSEPASIYAIGSEVTGPPLLKINLLTANGSIAVIEAAAGSPDLPTRRDLHLIATDGEIVHRIGKDDLLWSEGRASPLPGSPSLDDLRPWGADVDWNLAVSGALARSLATGETVRVGEEVE